MDAKTKQIFISNLILLGFNAEEKSYRKCELNLSMFDKPNNNGFIVVIHYLFQKINLAKTNHLFKSCYPASDKKQISEFRKHAYTWLRELSDINPAHNIPKIKSTLLLSPCGEELIRVLNSLSSFVLFKYIDKHISGKAPLGIKFNKHINQAQVKFMEVLSLNDYKELILSMKTIKQTDQKLLKLSKELTAEFHSLQKRNKIALKAKKELVASGLTNESKMIAAKQKEIRNLQEMWRKLDETNQEMSQNSDVVHHLITRTSENVLCLGGSNIEPTVPNLLVEKCQEEIYQNVGTSLYQDQKVNLSSLMFLWNLSLKILLEKIYSVPLPNFEKQLHFVQTLLRVQQNNKTKLFDISRKLTVDYEELKSSKNKYETLLDNLYVESKGEIKIPDKIFYKLNSSQPTKTQPFRLDGQFENNFLLPETEESDFLQEIVAYKIKPKPAKPFPTISLNTLYNPEDTMIENKENIKTKTTRSGVKVKKQSSCKKKSSNSVKRKNVKQGILTQNRFELQKPTDLIMSPAKEIIPRSENKLMDMIVNEVMDDNSTFGVYEHDHFSQLDGSAFVSKDKLARSPAVQLTFVNGKQNIENTENNSSFFGEINLTSTENSMFLEKLENSMSTPSKSMYIENTTENFTPSKNSSKLKNSTEENALILNKSKNLNPSANCKQMVDSNNDLGDVSDQYVGHEYNISPNESSHSSRSHSPSNNLTVLNKITSSNINQSDDELISPENSFVPIHSNTTPANSISPTDLITTSGSSSPINSISKSANISISSENSTRDSISPAVSTILSSSTSQSNSPTPSPTTTKQNENKINAKDDLKNEMDFSFDLMNDNGDEKWLAELDTSMEENVDLIDLGENDSTFVELESQPTNSSIDLLGSIPTTGLATPLL